MSDTRQYSSGANQSEVRAYNERLMLSVLHHDGAMPGSEMARRTGLSSQTVSVILRKLERDGLTLRGESQKGRVGKPSVPMTINPEGLFSYGIKIGRRSTDLLLIDFSGTIHAERRLRYRYPQPAEVFGFIKASLRDIEAGMTADHKDRICGIGVATPFDLWRWHEQVGAPKASLEAWRELDPSTEIAGFSNLQVFIINDATAACRAEHMFGGNRAWRDGLYFFIASFLGGGVILNGSVYEGSHGNAGALGPLPSRLPDGREARLLDTASIRVLERRLVDEDIDPAVLWQQPQDWSRIAKQADQWLEETAHALARATLASCAVIDFQAVVIDGAMPPSLRNRLVARVHEELPRLDARGLFLPEVQEGRIGANASALGAAAKPLIAQYLLDSHSGFAPTS
ncbi:ROK family transcriptional regulator [Epibacterium sp. Ofav1-8]|uniref:ROK family transcriptional regulator n=1 Tax=Epibacterium sp. Ofav1-8 TaxID=2917735 RepID=UPI001EF67490|nr:ROK family transcriptional regulator [Epibacterium sp. Ofav1-8]MCG7624195.1 ROK family transcriptional regulator [Epibacterium sp. Ofav1-8]